MCVYVRVCVHVCVCACVHGIHVRGRGGEGAGDQLKTRPNTTISSKHYDMKLFNFKSEEMAPLCVLIKSYGHCHYQK